MMPSGFKRAGGRSDRPAGGILPQLSWYILKQLFVPIALLTLLLTGVILMTVSLRLLDLVVTRGQSVWIFLYLTGLELPQLLIIILPIAFFLGILITLSRLSNESELVVMASAGYSPRQLAVPVFIAAALIMVLTWGCALWLSPAGQRALSQKEIDIRADVAGALLNAGEFNNTIKGLTVFIRQLDSDGQLHGVMVHDSRNPNHAVLYLAQRGILAQTPAGATLFMFDGTIEQNTVGGTPLSVATFQTWPIDLDQFANTSGPTLRNASERYLGELLHPTEARVTSKIRNTYLAEANDRLSQPLYCLAFAMIALAAILRSGRQRGAKAFRLTIACLAAVALRIAGYGAFGAAASQPNLNGLLYAIPALGLGTALLVMMGYSPRALFARHAPIARNKQGTAA